MTATLDALAADPQRETAAAVNFTLTTPDGSQTTQAGRPVAARRYQTVFAVEPTAGLHIVEATLCGRFPG